MKHAEGCPDEEACLCPPDEGALPIMKYEVARSQLCLGEWQVEAVNYDSDGECYVALFSGPGAKERAVEYAGFKNGQLPCYDEPAESPPTLANLSPRAPGW